MDTYRPHYNLNDYHPYPIAGDDETPAARVAVAIADPSSQWRRDYLASSAPLVSPAAVAAIARAVDRDYGEAGYSLAIVGGNSRGAVARVEHFDGSRFLLVADRYENVRRVPEPEAISCPVRLEEAAAA